MLNKTCLQFLDELASKAPVPGGGSASALTAAIGMALGSMVGELTIGKKKYAEYENELSELLFRSSELIKEFENCVNLDVKSFEPLSKAFKMPSSTEAEKKAKAEATQEALIPAVEAPLYLAETCVKALKVLDSYSLIGSKLVISDAGTGVALCEAALKGARLNVLVNLKMMRDETLKLKYIERIDAATDAGTHMAELTYKRVENDCK